MDTSLMSTEILLGGKTGRTVLNRASHAFVSICVASMAVSAYFLGFLLNMC